MSSTVSIPQTGRYQAEIGPISQAQINSFGQLAGTFGKIHTDPVWAAQTPLGGVIVQGMLVLSPIHDVLERIFGSRWVNSGEMSCKIFGSTRPEEPTFVEVDVRTSDSAGAQGTFAVRKGDGKDVISGDFRIGGGT
jgi:acyl dehydratase